MAVVRWRHCQTPARRCTGASGPWRSVGNCPHRQPRLLRRLRVAPEAIVQAIRASRWLLYRPRTGAPLPPLPPPPPRPVVDPLPPLPPPPPPALAIRIATGRAIDLSRVCADINGPTTAANPASSAVASIAAPMSRPPRGGGRFPIAAESSCSAYAIGIVPDRAITHHNLAGAENTGPKAARTARTADASAATCSF